MGKTDWAVWREEEDWAGTALLMGMVTALASETRCKFMRCGNAEHIDADPVLVTTTCLPKQVTLAATGDPSVGSRQLQNTDGRPA